MNSTELPPLVFWAGCQMYTDILDRAEGLHAGGFAASSCLVGDLVAWERSGRSLGQLRRELDAREMPIGTVDPYLAWYPTFDPHHVSGAAAAHLGATEDDALRYAEEMGATYFSVVGPFDGPDGSFEECVENLGRFADRAAAIGVRPHLEIIPTTKVPDLETALALVSAVDRPNFGLLMDTYNLARAGISAADLERVPRELVFQIQLADAPAVRHGTDYFDDAFHYRQLPGEGELAVAEMVQCFARKGPLPPTGPEVFADDLNAMPPAAAGRRSGEITRAFLTRVLSSAEARG